MSLEHWKYRILLTDPESDGRQYVKMRRKSVSKSDVSIRQCRHLSPDSWIVKSVPRWPLRLCLLARDELLYRRLLP